MPVGGETYIIGKINRCEDNPIGAWAYAHNFISSHWEFKLKIFKFKLTQQAFQILVSTLQMILR